jgi:RNA polymerase sigma-70 factor (ECF subfamily)
MNLRSEWTVPGRVAECDGRAEPAPELGEVMAQEAPRMLALAYSILRDRDQAADAVQDALERALRFRSSLRTPERASAWLSTICVREALRRYRRRRLTALLPLPRGAAEPIVVDPGPDVDLAHALSRLSARQRAVVGLHYVYGYTLDEAAEALGCRPGTVRRHLHRALACLREEIGHD